MGTFWILLVIVVIISVIIVAFAKWLGDEDGVGAAIGATLVCLIFGGIFLVSVFFASFYNDHVATCTITDKDRGGDNGSYRVYTSDCGTLENTDAWFRGKFDSADVWEQIPSSGTVTVHLVGARIPLLSSFPNILEIVGGHSSE